MPGLRRYRVLTRQVSVSLSFYLIYISNFNDSASLTCETVLHERPVAFDNGRQATWSARKSFQRVPDTFPLLLLLPIPERSASRSMQLLFSGRFVLFSCPSRISVCTFAAALVVSRKLPFGTIDGGTRIFSLEIRLSGESFQLFE